MNVSESWIFAQELVSFLFLMLFYFDRITDRKNLMKAMVQEFPEDVTEILDSQGCGMCHHMIARWTRRRCSNMEPRVL